MDLSTPAEFHPFTATHAVTVVVASAITLVLLVLGVLGREKPLGTIVHRCWLGFVLVVQVVNIVFFATPPRLDPATSLPLHICDLAGIIAVLDLMTRHRVLMAMMLYWGVGLSLQGFVLPVVREGPETFRFFLFFASHLSIVATGLYDVVVRQFRPTWRDCAIAFTITITYLVIILPINIMTGWNYGYVANPAPPAANPAAFLGAWPLRVLWMTLLVLAGFALITWLCRDRSRLNAPPTP